MNNHEVIRKKHKQRKKPQTPLQQQDSYTLTASELRTPANIIALQRTIGNRATQRLLNNSPIVSETTHVQRSEWWESLSESVSSGLDTAGNVAESVWNTIMGGDPKKEGKKKPKRPSKPNYDAEYKVTDKQALIRTPPPELDSQVFSGVIIPEGTKVKIINGHVKDGKQYVEVEVVPFPIGLPSGWTKYTNLSLSKGTPEPGEPEEPTDDDVKSPPEELDKIRKIKPPAYEEQPGDAAKREKIIEEANSAKAKHLAALTDKLEKAQKDLTPEMWFANINPGATFLGVPIKGQRDFRGKKLGGVHNELYEKLKVAEQILMDETSLDVMALGKKFGIDHIGGLRPIQPASGSSGGVGLHSLGLAIDIGTKNGPNPDIKEKTKWKNPETKKEEIVKTANASVIDRAAQFVKLGMSAQFAIGNKASKGTGKTPLEKRVTQADQWWDVMHDASEAFKIYLQFETKMEVEVGGQTFKLEELADAFGRETGDVRRAVEWQEQIKQDRHNLGGALGKQPDKGFLNLDKSLVMALVKAGLSWGATLDNRKDIHHFGLYDGTIKFPKVSSTA